MLVKLLLIITFLFTPFLWANSNYPKTYDKLGTPLFNAAQYFIKYKEIESLQELIVEYDSEVNRSILAGYKADATQNQNQKKIYLKQLRKLQALYDILLHNLHKSISESIKNDDYKLFLELTSYAFDGLFINSNLRNRAIAFYTKHKHEKNFKCNVLEKSLAYDKLSSETQELFAAEIIHSSYNSKSAIQAKKSVYISATRVQNSISIFLHNKNIYDVTINMHYNLKNIKMQTKAPLEFVVKANSKYKYATLLLGSGEAQYSFSWTYSMGSKDAIHDKNYVYRLPYKKGTSHLVSQSYNGRNTHKGNSAYSIDFAMPMGTKVYASRGGVVVKTKSNSDIGGYDKKYASSGNYVKIMHSDGTFAIYYHLKYNGVIVKVGEKVSKGEPLAYSGNTGYSSGPHLHFSVFKTKSAGSRETIATRFKILKGLLKKPIRGNYYKAI
ncbi:M23 family metallopeptidase [Sulfurimonas sp. SAG-AH-194-L11]|nr:M23 family metallopeptidase [Sulfurimonas sp. SAG-AH-194-L11]MDF1876667.1 M23 family metallopeptidase [Sulfurimonas sp. SAG-AH-194-L11]